MLNFLGMTLNDLMIINLGKIDNYFDISDDPILCRLCMSLQDGGLVFREGAPSRCKIQLCFATSVLMHNNFNFTVTVVHIVVQFSIELLI